MKTWDILDSDEHVEVTHPTGKGTRLVNAAVSSAAKVFVMVGCAFVGSGTISVAQPLSAAMVQARVSVVRPGRVPTTRATRQTSEGTDTNFGQSSEKLAARFEAFFRPVADEEEAAEDGYCFG